MPDWKKRVLKERSADIRPDETLQEATYYQGYGSASAQIAFGVARGVADLLDTSANPDILADRARSKSLAETADGRSVVPGSTAAMFPQGVGVVAFTNLRLIVFGYKQGMFKTKILEPTVAVNRQDIVGWSFKPDSVAGVLKLAFADQSEVAIEIPRLNKPAQFAEALGIPTIE